MLRKPVVITALLFMGATSAKAHNMAGMPQSPTNTYAVARTVSYYKSMGTNGTVFIAYGFTGSTQSSPMCTTPGVQHQPRVAATLLANGKSTYQSAQGQNVGPCTNINQTLTLSFDLAANDCNLIDLDNGNCTLTDEPIIFCSMLGHGFGSLSWLNIQFETAVTYSVISALIKADGFKPQAPYCSIPSSPPDLEPATEASPSVLAGQYVESSFMWREIPWGQTNFFGVPWNRVVPINPEEIIPPTFEAPDCTNWDKGFRGIPFPIP